MNQDLSMTCRDCKRSFVFTMQEQQQFKARGFSNPARCPECRKKRSPRARSSAKNAPIKVAATPAIKHHKPEVYSAPCSVCGQDTVLRFKPTGLIPVFCPQCFEKEVSERMKVDAGDFTKRKQVKMSLEEVAATKIGPVQVIEQEPEAAPVQMREPIRERVVSADGLSEFAQFGLAEELNRSIREAGYDIPTPVQLAAIPIALSRQDIIGTAQTGTGKTAAFVLPILHHLLSNPTHKACTRALVLTPTRELAEQISDSFKQLGRHTRIRIATVYGGVGMEPQERALRTGADVIVACPGRLLDHMGRGNTDFSHLENLVLDEADRMLDMGFLPSIREILSKLPSARQTMLFSATFADELNHLAKNTLKDPQRVDVDICAPPNTISHVLYPCPQHLKTKLVLSLLDKTDTNSVLIFTRTKHRANRVCKQIEAAGHSSGVLHSNKSQNQRQSALDDFKAGRCQILVATDIAARGLDVETISHVINYDIPDTADTYIHRIGRTGRAEREGDAMTLITKDDAAIVFDIEKVLGRPIERIKLDDFDYNAPTPNKDEFKRDPMPPRRPRNAPSAPRVKVAPSRPHERPGKPEAPRERPTGELMVRFRAAVDSSAQRDNN